MKRSLAIAALLPISTSLMAHPGPLHSHAALPLGVAIAATVVAASMLLIWRRR